MNDNDFKNKVEQLTLQSKEELVRAILEKPKFSFNTDGLAQLLDEFLEECQIQKLTLQEWDSKRKKQKKMASRIVHISQSECTIEPKKYEGYGTEVCTIDLQLRKAISAPKEVFVYGTQNQFDLVQIRNALNIWADSRKKDDFLKSWLDSQSDKAWGLALKKIGCGKWRTTTGYRYLLRVPPTLTEIFHSNRRV